MQPAAAAQHEERPVSALLRDLTLPTPQQQLARQAEWPDLGSGLELPYPKIAAASTPPAAARGDAGAAVQVCAAGGGHFPFIEPVKYGLIWLLQVKYRKSADP
jgi:hypothetical protein